MTRSCSDAMTASMRTWTTTPSRPLERRTNRRSCWLGCGFVLLVLLGVGAVGVQRTQLKSDSRQKYVVVIDAGSTGTRLYVYKYDLRDPNLHLTWIPPEAAKEAIPYRPGIRAYNRVETLPGLQSITLEALKSDNSTNQLYETVDSVALDPLLNWARAVIPSDFHQSTPLRLLATAGVRGLRPAQQETLMTVLDVILAESGFKYDKHGIEVMSGHQEGIYGWVALNHELGIFNASSSVPPAPGEGHLPRRGLPGNPLSTRFEESLEPGPWTDLRIGALDLGGSSLEVTFPAANHPTSTPLEISGSEYWLESKTFDALGLNNAFQTSLWLEALKMNGTRNDAVELKYPCLFDGYTEEITLYPPKHLPEHSQRSFNITLVGSGSWQDCKSLVEQVVTESDSCGSSCWGAAADIESLRFVGLNGFHVVWKFFNLSNNASLSELESRGTEFCHQNWTTVQREKQDIVQFEKFCFRSAFVSQLLQSMVDYDVTDVLTVAPESVSWPIGAAYLQIQPDWGKAVPFTAPSHFQLPPEAATAVGFLGVVLLGYVCVRAVQRQARVSGYGELNPDLDASLKAISRLHRVHEIKRRTFSYRRLHDLSL